MDCSPPDSTCLWEFPGKNTGVGCHFLLWGNLPKIKVLTEFDPFGGCEGRMCYCPLSRLVDGHLLPGFVSVQATGLANWRVYVVRPYNRTTRGKVNIWQACQKVCNTTIRKPGNNLFFISNYRSALCLQCSILNVLLSHSWPQMFSAELQGNSFSPSISLPNAKVVETQWRLFLWIDAMN